MVGHAPVSLFKKLVDASEQKRVHAGPGRDVLHVVIPCVREDVNQLAEQVLQSISRAIIRRKQCLHHLLKNVMHHDFLLRFTDARDEVEKVLGIFVCFFDIIFQKMKNQVPGRILFLLEEQEVPVIGQAGHEVDGNREKNAREVRRVFFRVQRVTVQKAAASRNIVETPPLHDLIEASVYDVHKLKMVVLVHAVGHASLHGSVESVVVLAVGREVGDDDFVLFLRMAGEERDGEGDVSLLVKNLRAGRVVEGDDFVDVLVAALEGGGDGDCHG